MVMGEDVGHYGGSYKVGTRGSAERRLKDVKWLIKTEPGAGPC